MLIFLVWGFISIIVIYFLISRWLNPHIKGISNKDLIDYLEVSVFFVIILFVLQVALKKRN